MGKGRTMTIEAFIADLKPAFDDAAIVHPDGLESYTRNTSEYRRDVPLAVRPTTAEQVQHLVRTARAHKVPLYAFSQGKNWGLGSKLPVKDGCVLVDLRDMNRIIEVNDTFGYAVVEPGVTQRQLADHLAAMGSRHFLDVTGSGADTSLVGNSLERGVAYNSIRAEMLLAVEVVLGTGELLKPGWGHLPDPGLTPLNRYGVGPQMDGLFSQSNYGIVTRGTIQLVPRPEYQSTFMISLKDESQLGPLFEAMRELHHAGVLDSIVHVGNKRRGELTLTPLIYNKLKDLGQEATRERANAIVQSQLKGPWSALGILMGTKGVVGAMKKRVRQGLGRFGSIKFLTPGLLELAKTATGKVPVPMVKEANIFLLGVEPLMKLTNGNPTNAALHSTYWSISESSPAPDQPDDGPGGILFTAPMLPMTGEAVARSNEAIKQVGKEYGFDIAITYNMMHGRTIEGVVSLDFRRDDAQEVTRAQACLRALHQVHIDLGYYPYRMDIQNMDLMVDENDLFWQVARDFKSVLDPDNIIAPGRYNLV